MYVYKALLKIAFSFIDKKDIGSYSFTKKYLTDLTRNFSEVHSNLNIFNQIIQVTFPHIDCFPNVRGILFKRRNNLKNQLYPERVFVLFLKCIAFQIPVIFSEKDLKNFLGKNAIGYKLPPINTNNFLPEYIQQNFDEPLFKVVDLSGKELKKDDIFSIETMEVNWVYKEK